MSSISTCCHSICARIWNRLFASIGLKESNFKILNGDKFLDRNKEIDSYFDDTNGIYWYAFESLGAPKKWKRFKSHYEYSTWSNSGNNPDGIIYIATKSLTIAGFVSYAAKDDPDYELKYRLQIDGSTVEEWPPKKYSNWEDTFFKTILFNNTHDVNENSKIWITIWISRNFSSSTNVNTYYGSDGYNFATVENEHMGLFTVDSSGESSNGTSVSSGQIPAILYYLD